MGGADIVNMRGKVKRIDEKREEEKKRRGERPVLTASCSSNVILKWLKIRDIIRLIEDDGWYLVATKGSHRQYKHTAKPGRVTISGHPGDDIASGTLNSVLKQAGLKEGR